MSLVTTTPVWNEMNQQRIYRLLLEAISYPGRVVNLRPYLGDAHTPLAILAALVDEEVSFADPDNRITPLDRRLLAAPCVDVATADYILQDATLPPGAECQPKRGTLYRPDSSATMILVGSSVVAGSRHLRLWGPGVRGTAELHLDGFDSGWLVRRAEWVSNFPMGVDLLLCDTDQVVGIPRTCRIEILD